MKVGSAFHCAKNYETAAFIYKDLKEFNKMAELVSTGGELLRKTGAPDSASYLYERAAKAIEQAIPERAAEFYERSADSCEVEDKYHEAADQCNNSARIWVRLRRFADAERLLRRFIEFSIKANPCSAAATLSGVADSSAVPKLCSRAVVVMILIKLHQEDEVAANKIFDEAMQCLLYHFFFSLCLQYVRLMKEIKIPAYDLGVDKSDVEPKPSGAGLGLSQLSPAKSTAPRSVASERPEEQEEYETFSNQPQPTTTTTTTTMTTTTTSGPEEEEEDIC
ncbi:unnamed protein product [Echinostoma caproni]|uniref:Gamma-soluble NSF attachment protein n=1 Tax=Echinostoma caproni TaxID=27848 RepID=A0A183ADF8_9TREM|nr:unnamed protein product [Echinostoma caproni]